MITIEKLLLLDKNDLQDFSEGINKDDLDFLVELLNEKDDKIRYQAFLLLQSRSINFDDVYPYWDLFSGKLTNDNSYQRSIGLMLIAQNTKWDKDNKIDKVIDRYLRLLNDEKPITVRQCIQSLEKIIPYKQNLHLKVADELMKINILNQKETMRKLIQTDILNILILIRSHNTNDKIESYIFKAITGGILDAKTIKQFEMKLKK